MVFDEVIYHNHSITFIGTTRAAYYTAEKILKDNIIFWWSLFSTSGVVAGGQRFDVNDIIEL